MPQASEKLRRLWGGRLGIGDDKALDYLRKAGYRLTSNFEWRVPADHTITVDEYGAMAFLCEEWDYGGLAR